MCWGVWKPDRTPFRVDIVILRTQRQYATVAGLEGYAIHLRVGVDSGVGESVGRERVVLAGRQGDRLSAVASRVAEHEPVLEVPPEDAAGELRRRRLGHIDRVAQPRQPFPSLIPRIAPPEHRIIRIIILQAVNAIP